MDEAAQVVQALQSEIMPPILKPPKTVPRKYPVQKNMLVRDSGSNDSGAWEYCDGVTYHTTDASVTSGKVSHKIAVNCYFKNVSDL